LERATIERNGTRFIFSSLGSGDAWPCYWRPFVIAAYRRVVALEQEELLPPKQTLLRALLQCCPPSTATIKNKSMLDEKAMRDARNQLCLDLCGIYPIFELMTLYKKSTNIVAPVILRVSVMCRLLRAFLPRMEEDLTATPYANVGECHNLADERWDKVAEALETAAKYPYAVGFVE
jgi:hypothetical protein